MTFPWLHTLTAILLGVLGTLTAIVFMDWWFNRASTSPNASVWYRVTGLFLMALIIAFWIWRYGVGM